SDLPAGAKRSHRPSSFPMPRSPQWQSAFPGRRYARRRVEIGLKTASVLLAARHGMNYASATACKTPSSLGKCGIQVPRLMHNPDDRHAVLPRHVLNAISTPIRLPSNQRLLDKRHHLRRLHVDADELARQVVPFAGAEHLAFRLLDRLALADAGRQHPHRAGTDGEELRS